MSELPRDIIVIKAMFQKPKTQAEIDAQALKDARDLALGVQFLQKCRAFGTPLPGGFDAWIERLAGRILQATK